MLCGDIRENCPLQLCLMELLPVTTGAFDGNTKNVVGGVADQQLSTINLINS